MASISAYDSSSISTLFSSLGNSSSSNSGSLSSLYSSLSDYNSIRTGAYGKVVKAYYAKIGATDSSTSTSTTNKDKVSASTATSKDTSKVLANIEAKATDLTSTATGLYTKNNNKVFATNSDGSYDVNKIYDKVSDFVEQYNSVLSATAKSSVSSITSAAKSMTNLTNLNANALSAIGISIDKDNSTLSIKEESFKKADMSSVKSLFNGTGSYGYSVAVQASMIDAYAQNEASKANTYTSTGTYSNNNNTGSIFSDYL